MPRADRRSEVEAFVRQVAGKEIKYRKDQAVFSQGEPADSVFYVRSGTIKLKVNSRQGKEAVIGVLGAGSFVGEGCLTDP